MVSNGDKWHYFAVKKLSALFRGETSNHHGDCYCLNCSLDLLKKYVEIKIFVTL